MRGRGSEVELVACAFVGVGVEFFGKEAREESFVSGPDGVGRLMTTRVRLGSGLMGRLAISSSVSRCSVEPIPSSSLPRRFRRATCGSVFGMGNALLVFGFGWLAAELFDWLLGRVRSVGVGAELLLVADGGRARVLRRDVGDDVAEGGRAADLGGEFAAPLPAFAFIILAVNFGAVRLRIIYTYIKLGKRRSDRSD